MIRAAAKERSSPDRCPAERRCPPRRRRLCTRKLASGGQTRRRASHPAFSGCKSLNEPGIPVRVRRTCVGFKGRFLPFGGDYQAGTPAGALENRVFLRLPGQWHDFSWTDATTGAGLCYNLARWVEPQAGRYTRPDPAGRLGEPHPYLYARVNPVSLSDFLGLKSRACCPPITGGLLGTFKHCFIEIEDEQGKKETHVLHGMGTPRRSWEGPIGCTFPNDPFDQGAPDQPGYECGPWNDFEEGELRRAEVIWVDVILHAKTLPIHDFCSPEA